MNFARLHAIRTVRRHGGRPSICRGENPAQLCERFVDRCDAFIEDVPRKQLRLFLIDRGFGDAELIATIRQLSESKIVKPYGPLH